MKKLSLEVVPAWVPAPPKRNRRGPEIALISHPDGHFTVASRDEIDALLQPDSFLGRMLRGHAALMSLPYQSNN
jgi:hypothetical protein